MMMRVMERRRERRLGRQSPLLHRARGCATYSGGDIQCNPIRTRYDTMCVKCEVRSWAHPMAVLLYRVKTRNKGHRSVNVLSLSPLPPFPPSPLWRATHVPH